MVSRHRNASFYILLLLVLFCLSGCVPEKTAQVSSSAKGSINTSEKNSTHRQNADVPVFGYDRLTDVQQSIYDVLSSSRITADTPYYFDEPLDYSVVHDALFLYQWNTQNETTVPYYTIFNPGYTYILTDHLLQKFACFSYGDVLNGVPETGPLVPLDGKSCVCGIKLDIDDGSYGEDSISREDYDKLINEFDEAADGWLEQLPVQNASDYEKINALARMMCDRIEYGFSDFDASPYGGIVEGKAICEGYAKTFDYFAKRMGIETVIVNGRIHASGGSHAWNMVVVDEKWYHVDVTFMDTGVEGVYDDNYFLKSSDTFRVLDHEAFEKLNFVDLDLGVDVDGHNPIYDIPPANTDFCVP